MGVTPPKPVFSLRPTLPPMVAVASKAGKALIPAMRSRYRIVRILDQRSPIPRRLPQNKSDPAGKLFVRHVLGHERLARLRGALFGRGYWPGLTANGRI